MRTQCSLCRETEAALDLWTDLRSNASTPSTFVDPNLMPSNFPSNLRKRARSGELADGVGAADVGAHAGDIAACAPNPSAAEPLARASVHDNSSRIGTGSKSASGSGSPAAAAAAAAARTQQQVPAAAAAALTSGQQRRHQAASPRQTSPHSIVA